MDLLLPDENTMQKMALEFAKLNTAERAKASARALSRDFSDPFFAPLDDVENAKNSLHMHKIAKNDARPQATDGTSEQLPSAEEKRDISSDVGVDKTARGPLATRNQKALPLALLYLYFIGVLGYNSSYGTQIYDPQRSLGELRSVACPFGKLNDLC